jgi:beta-ureidopropionase / N-carbamoyl-L-amino-acid hydrolase
MNAPSVAFPRAGEETLRDIAVRAFEELARETGDGVGITRECYAEGEDRALALFRDLAEAHGLVCQTDAAAGIIIRLPNDEGTAPAIYIGSHADSVPQGGNYDGAAGVVAGILCLIGLQRQGAELPTPVRVMILRAEESAFYSRSNIGARVLLGALDPKDLLAKRGGTGRTLREAMASVGIDVDRVAAGERLFDPKMARAFLELHIEQGPVMVARKLPTAIVTGIRGNIRHRAVVCRGEAGHSGAVPRWLRKDAVFAVADLLMRLDEHWSTLLQRGLDLVVTTGIIGTNPGEHALSRIPGEVQFSFEVRSQSHDTIEAFYELFRSECRAIAAQRGVTFTFDDRVYTEPARMDEGIMRKLAQASERIGIVPEMIPSGAGHDSAVFANEGVPSAMVFIRNENGSHNPREAMDIDDFLKGVELLTTAITDGI